MTTIFVNLKRFDIPAAAGGICPEKDSAVWAGKTIDRIVELGLFAREGFRIVFFFPEGLLVPARAALGAHSSATADKVFLGCQGVFREDVSPGGNFGAFTTNLPAKAASALGCSWALVGHSEERKDKFDILAAYDGAVRISREAMKKANDTVHGLINAEVLRAFEAGLNVLLCVGETAEEKGEGSFDLQKPRVEAVLKDQLELGLAGVEKVRAGRELAIGYEPRWAIGPGKTPPGPDYIGFVSGFIKKTAAAVLGYAPAVVYGGGLKTENARAIAGIETIDGGLVALTKFTPPIAFSPEGLEEILEEYFVK
jgi:triosephosphate isomerase